MTRNFRTLFGLFLILAGLLFGAQQFDLISGDVEDSLFTALFAFGTLFLFSMYLQDRSRWWALFVSFILLGLALQFSLDLFLPSLENLLGGSIFLLMLGIGFLSIYLVDRMMWWALIPGGVMLSLTLVTLWDDLNIAPGFDDDGILFIGLGLTFLLLYLLPVEGQRLSWAIFPAIPLLIFGLFIGLENAQAWDYIWPSLIILAGLYLIFSSLRSSGGRVEAAEEVVVEEES